MATRRPMAILVSLVLGASVVGVAPSVAVELTPPGTPTQVVAVPGDGQVTVSWTAPLDDGGSPVTAYYADATGDGSGGQCTTGSATTCTITGLNNFDTFSVTVQAENDQGRGVPSDPVAVGPLTAPVAPTGVRASAIPGRPQSLRVSWLYPSEAQGRVLFTATASTLDAVEVASCTVPDDPCVLRGLVNGTEYVVVVVARNSAGSATSTPVRGTPAGVPSFPESPTVRAGNGSVMVSWLAANPEGSPITGYTASVYGEDSGQLQPEGPGVASCATDGGTACTIPGLANGTTYWVRVRATNDFGDGPWTPALAVTPLPIPGAPGNVRAAPGDGRATVTWTAPPAGDLPITGYTATASPGGRTCVTAGSTRCVITGLSNGRAYTFRVTARNGAGTSWPSGPSGPVTPKPPVVVKVRAINGRSALFVDVNPNKGAGYWVFQVQRRAGAAWVPRNSYRTLGALETRTLNLPRGTYRVVVGARYGYARTVSASVYLTR